MLRAAELYLQYKSATQVKLHRIPGARYKKNKHSIKKMICLAWNY